MSANVGTMPGKGKSALRIVLSGTDKWLEVYATLPEGYENWQGWLSSVLMGKFQPLLYVEGPFGKHYWLNALQIVFLDPEPR